ncbi:MAG: hypothetical protein ABSF71_40255 [Terriglobia bacterium]|jgi:hypothetical protein
MLPDYPDLKRELRADLNLQFRLLVNMHAPLASRIRSYHQTEGDQFAYETTEGKLVTKRFLRMEAKIELPRGLSSSETYEDFLRQTSEAAKSIAQQSEGVLFSTFEEETKQVGNAIDVGGKPFHPDIMWDAIEKMDLDFDERTEQPKMPTIVVHPEMMKAIAAKIPEWEADVALQKRRTEVLRKRKEEWRDRESRRKLVG